MSRRDRRPDAGADRRRAGRDLNARGERLRAELNRVAADRGRLSTPPGRGSLMTIHPGPRAFNASEPVGAAPELLKRLLFFELLDSGQWIASRGMIALSLPVT